MKKLLTVSCYFGKLPEHFPIFLRSVEKNPTIDFLLITDCSVDAPPSNFRILPCTFEEMRERLQALFDFPIVLDRPYKLCDYKPVWGLAFGEYLAGYDFWGYCDLDLIFGNIRSFLPDSVLDNYDKIYKLGHLTYYRNTDENNARYRLDNWLTYKDAFTTPEIMAFDEIAGMQNIYDRHQIPTYVSRDYADITYGKVQFTLSYFQIPPELAADNNYDKQVFYWEDGKVYRAYLKDDRIMREEFNYIHFSKRKMALNAVETNDKAFFITNKGLFPKDTDIRLDSFDQYNPHNTIAEMKRSIECWSAAKRNQIKYYARIISRKLGNKR